MESDPIEVVLGYHERTKHHLRAYANSLGYMDWATQPDPFRRFDGSPRIQLDEVPVTATPTYDSLFAATALPARPLDRATLSQFLYDSLALSAWKEFGNNRWALRVNPSSGNLHPTEGYLLTGPIPGVVEEPGLFHYAPFDHALEQRRVSPREAWESLGLPPGAFLVGLTSILWREAWKYGERAFRYCQHDAGHALGALTISAASLGWKVAPVNGISDDTLAKLLGVADQDGPEAEHPDVLLLVSPTLGTVDPSRLEAIASEALQGTRNVLSSDHHDWPIIDVVAEATRTWARAPGATDSIEISAEAVERNLAARQIIRQRRSAVDMDGVTSISRDEFLLMMARARSITIGDTPHVHLAVFVHRVRDLEPGLYFLVRDQGALPSLRAAMRPEFEWSPVAGSLYRLLPSNAQETARTVSCGQEIAADGAFALGMIAHFEPIIREHGAWFYKRLHWEAGAIGQVLYLEAEAAGVRATGIGCFFDDAMHQVLGLRDAQFQTIYHFTVGSPVEDTRLRTVPAYAHRAK